MKHLLFLSLMASALAQPCVIVHEHVHKFGENMSRWSAHKPYDYIEGQYPQGFKFQTELDTKRIRAVREKGGKVVIMKTDYTPADLKDAREQCKSDK